MTEAKGLKSPGVFIPEEKGLKQAGKTTLAPIELTQRSPHIIVRADKPETVTQEGDPTWIEPFGGETIPRQQPKQPKKQGQ